MNRCYFLQPLADITVASALLLRASTQPLKLKHLLASALNNGRSHIEKLLAQVNA